MQERDDDLALAIAPLSTREDFTLFTTRASRRISIQSRVSTILETATQNYLLRRVLLIRVFPGDPKLVSQMFTSAEAPC